MRIGLLGASRIAEKAVIAPAQYFTDVTITAVAARDGAKAQSYAQKHGIAHAVEGHDALIARDDIDLIYNALPPNHHASMSIAALEAGKAVLCEKPFAMSGKEATYMVDAAKAAGQPLLEAFHYRFHPAFDLFLNLLAHIGTIHTAQAVISGPIPNADAEIRYNKDLGGGALMDLGCYGVHWLRTVLGDDVHVSSAQAGRADSGVDVRFSAELIFGAIPAKLECSMAEDSRKAAFIRLEGSQGHIHFDNPLAPHDGHYIHLVADSVDVQESGPKESTYLHQLKHVKAVLEEGAMPLTGGSDAIANMHVIDALQAAAR